MAVTITRHKLSSRGVRQVFRSAADGLQEVLRSVETNPEAASIHAGTARRVFFCGMTLNPDDPGPARALRVAGLMHAAVFGCALSPRQEYSFALGRRQYTVRGRPGGGSLSAGDWADAFFTNLLVGQEAELDMLCRYPVARMKKSTKVVPPWNDVTNAVQLLWTGEEGARQPLSAALAKAKASKNKWMKWIGRHVVELFVLQADPAAGDPDEVLKDAVAAHKKYWTSSADLDGDCTGFIALELSAIMVWGVRSGRPLVFESDYTPIARLLKMFP